MPLANHVRRQSVLVVVDVTRESHSGRGPRVVVHRAPRAELAVPDLLELAVEIAQSVALDESFEEMRGRYSWCPTRREEFT